MFISRTQELTHLEERYNSGEFEFVCIYGRRRVGKTELIKEFVKGKRTVFFSALEDTFDSNLAAFSSAISEGLRGFATNAVFHSFEDALTEICEAARGERVVLVIDEYPYIAKRNTAFASILQHTIDHKFKDTQLFLILCGSSMSFMEHQVMGHKSPLYGRRTGQIKLLPFDYYDSSLFFQNFTREEKAVIFGLTGGIPKYLTLFHDSVSLKDNIIRNFFRSDTVLFEEPANLLKQEVNEAAIYNSILTSIAGGSSQLNKIATKTHIESSQCVYYLKSLIELGIVKKEVPFGEKETSKKTIYRLNDGMFRFWYRFVYRNTSRILMGHGEEIYRQIEPEISDFMGEVFEQICMSYLWSLNGGDRLPFSFANIGRWWGNNPMLKSEQEIDLIAADFHEERGLFCECKWTNEKVPESVINKLLERAAMFHYREKYYCIFSKNGFTDSAWAKADDRVKLVEFKDMLTLT